MVARTDGWVHSHMGMSTLSLTIAFAKWREIEAIFWRDHNYCMRYALLTRYHIRATISLDTIYYFTVYPMSNNAAAVIGLDSRPL